VNTLLARDPASHASLDFQPGVAALLEVLSEAGMGDAVSVLAGRASTAGMFSLFLDLHPEDATVRAYGREPDGSTSEAWKWYDPASSEPSRLQRKRP
jgi:hypothetical protein